MRRLLALLAALVLGLAGCSDDDNPADAGTDAAVVEASVDVGQEAAVEEAGPAEGGALEASPDAVGSDGATDTQGGE